MTDRFTVSEQGGFNMVWIKMPRYSGSGSPVRILNWFLFSFMLRFLPGFLKSKPDVVYYSSPSLIGYLGAERLARTTGARLFFEIRDIWPLTLQKLGGYTNNNPLIRFMYWVEKRAYKSADVLLSNLKGAGRYIKQVAGSCDQFFWVPNGILLDEVSNPDPLPDGDIGKIRTNHFVVGYAGAVGKVNAINVLVDAAELLKESHPEISFVVVGEGEQKKRLVSQVVEGGGTNVTFIGAVPKSQVQSVLSQFDALYLGWLNEDLYDFGIGANKIPEYLYAQKPVIHSYSGGCDPIAESGAGVTIPAEDSEKLAQAIVDIYEMSCEERSYMGGLGKSYAVENYDFERLSRKVASLIDS